ncbi:hypothetical protein PoB_005434700 [Plakobranchus ocellatus]|uniref:Uncharacterized protein n=1 Tax=Plakobranchus ocellatus TaxID=259542 RepID=A0AAV4C995_9GAST|nr:hypothetical protein PoB_005434700 [Plakobranchus ocellatus]
MFIGKSGIIKVRALVVGHEPTTEGTLQFSEQIGYSLLAINPTRLQLRTIATTSQCYFSIATEKDSDTSELRLSQHWASCPYGLTLVELSSILNIPVPSHLFHVSHRLPAAVYLPLMIPLRCVL